MSLTSALHRVLEHKLEPYVAPIFDSETTSITVVQDGIPYHFELSSIEPGWWLFNGRTPLRKAEPKEYLSYMDLLPRFYTVLLFPVSEYAWMSTPYNASDAEQRGWPNAYPRPIHCVRGTPKPLDVVDGRQLGTQLLYYKESSSVCRDTAIPAFDRAYHIIDERLENIRRREKKRSIGTKFNRQLSLMGAELVDWSQEGQDRFNVTWEYDGAQFVMPVRRSGMVISAGICLGGTDETHDLSSIVQCMEEARELHRFDLDEELWL